jgi:hypothetical protein
MKASAHCGRQPDNKVPSKARIEIGEKTVIGIWNEIGLVVGKEARLVEGENPVLCKMAVAYLWRQEPRLIRQLRLLQFKPFLFRRPRLQCRLEREEMIPNRAIIVDIDLAFRNIDQKQILALDAPALDVLAAKEGHKQFGRARVAGDQFVALLSADMKASLRPVTIPRSGAP